MADIENEKEVKWIHVATSTASPISNTQRKEVFINQEKCWLEDYEKEIVVSNPIGRYSELYDDKGNRRFISTGQRKYKISIPTKSNLDFLVEVRIKVVPNLKMDNKDSAIEKAKLNIKKGVDAHWNNKFKLKIVDPACGEKILNIKYRIIFVDGNEHFTLNVHSVYEREGVTGLIIDVSETTTDWVYAHEFGHCVGLPDEYGYYENSTGDTVKYYKPDGTLDSAISAPYDGKSSTAPDATIMAAANSIVILPRHAWNIAIEAQELLRKRIGRKIECDIL